MSRTRDYILTELLVLRTQQGDREAFGALVDLWQERLWLHAHALTDTGEQAWDAVQETWTAVVKGIGRLAEPAAFPRWAFRILTHKAADQVRRRQAEREAQQELAALAGTSERRQGAPGARVADLRDALAALPAAARQLLALHYAEGFTTAEVGQILGVPQGTVKSRLHHARRHLKRLMEEDDDDGR